MSPPNFSMFVNFADMTFRWSDALYNTAMFCLSHTDDTIPNSPSEEATSKYELLYPFVIKDYMIRNAVLNKLHKKIPLLEGEKNSTCMGIYGECIKYT